VVHAERREQSLQRVPVAISVFTGNERDVIGIQSVQDVTNFAPGFTYDPETVHAYLRGVGRQSFNVTDDARVAAYEDEFYVYSPYELDKSDLFLTQEQIERGPQSVGGKEADGGSIDMISVRPTDRDYAEMRFNVANYGTYNFEAALSGPIADGLNFRIAGYDHNTDQGILNNVVDRLSEGNLIHEWYVEPQIEWKPNENTDLWIRGFIAGWANRGDAGARNYFYTGSWDETQLSDSNVAPLSANPNFGYAAIPGSAAQAGASNPIANPFYGLPGQPATLNYLPSSVTLMTPGIYNNPSASNPLNIGALRPQTVELTGYDGVNGIFTYNFPDAHVELKYITGYQQYNYNLNEPLYDTDVLSFTMPLIYPVVPGATPLVVNTYGTTTYIEDDGWWSHELVLQSTGDSRLQWTAGAFYYQQHYWQPISENLPDQPQVADPQSAASIDSVIAGETLPNPKNLIVYQAYDFTYRDAAAYGQISYKFNDQFKLTGDIRYTGDKKSGWEQSRYVYFGSEVIDGYGPYYGNYTPALDITDSVVCLSGVASNCNSPSSGLGRGVASMGVIGPSGFATRQLAGSSSAVTGGVEAEWTPTSSILAYARYDRGYEALSFNAGVTGPEPATLPEFINSYQVGYKQAFGNTLLVDIDGFYYDFINQQVPLTVVSDGVVEPIFYNVPSSTSAGVELEAYWTPTHNWSFTFTYSFDYTAINTGCTGTVSGSVLTPASNSLCVEDTNDPAAVEPGARPFPGQSYAISGAVLQSVKGDPLPDAPENKLGADAAYTWHFEPGALTLSGAVVYRSTQAGTMFDRSYDNAPAWYGINLRAIWKAPGDKYEVIAYVDNLTNTLQYLVGYAGLGLAGSNTRTYNTATGLYEVNQFEIGPMRTFGVEVRYKFY